MTLPVDVPLLDPWWYYLGPLFDALRSMVVGVIAAVVVAFVLLKVLGRFRPGLGWRIILTASAVVFLVSAGWMWLSASDFTVIRVTPEAVELRFANWPWPAHRFAFDEIESVSLVTSRSRRAETYYLVIISKRPSTLGSTRWESSPGGNAERIALALEWIERASGGRLTRSGRFGNMLTSVPQR